MQSSNRFIHVVTPMGCYMFDVIKASMENVNSLKKDCCQYSGIWVKGFPTGAPLVFVTAASSGPGVLPLVLLRHSLE